MSTVYAGRMDRRTDMRAVVQRVSKAAVSVDQQEIGKIGYGLLVLLGIHETDTQKDVDYLVKKLHKCVFLKMNKEK